MHDRTTPGIANGGLEGCESLLFKGSSVLSGQVISLNSATVHTRKRCGQGFKIFHH